MPRFQHPLDEISVASPCPANWDDMIGTERARFCGQCSLNVYNLSAMTRTEAEDLISHTEGRLCVRFFRRSDGTVLTQNCPIGFAAVRARLKRRATAMLTTAFGFLAGIGVFSLFPAPNAPAETIRGKFVYLLKPKPAEQPMVGMLVEPTRERQRRGRTEIDPPSNRKAQ